MNKIEPLPPLPRKRKKEEDKMRRESSVFAEVVLLVTVFDIVTVDDAHHEFVHVD